MTVLGAMVMDQKGLIGILMILDTWLGMSSWCSIGFAGMDLGIDLLQAGEMKGEKME